MRDPDNDLGFRIDTMSRGAEMPNRTRVLLESGQGGGQSSMT
jgi:hypothetical protein